MSAFRPRFAEAGHRNYASHKSYAPARMSHLKLNQNFKWIAFVSLAILASNVVSHYLLNPRMGKAETALPAAAVMPSPEESLYLMDKASRYVVDTDLFERKVREISQQLGVYPEWLMAVMYSESQFDASVLNRKGSGATGLIQFMPATASELNVSLQRLQNMSHNQQLEYVYLYLQTVRDRYGEYDTLTDLYLAILYPKARKQDICYTLYAKPSKSYKQNSGLDEDKDGRVTVSDIDRRMARLYPTAYSKRKTS